MILESLSILFTAIAALSAILFVIIWIIMLLLGIFCKNDKVKKIENISLRLYSFSLFTVFVLNLDTVVLFLKSNISLTISLFALIISTLSLLYSNIFFNRKVLINKEKESIDGKNVTFLKITNNSNKDLKISKIKINNEELIHEYNNKQGNKKNIVQKIDGIDYHMFKYDKSFKVNRGTSIKIQYSRNGNCESFEVLNFKIEVHYNTLYFDFSRVIETDLSPYV